MVKTAFLLSITLIGLISVNSYVYAAKTLAECQAQKSTIEQHSKCLDRVKETVEKTLETWVNNQVFELDVLAKTSGRYTPLNLFKRSQKDFITYRDNNCKWQYLASTPTSAPAIYKLCYILLTENRIKELSIQSLSEDNKLRAY